jgi:integrase
MKGEKTGARTRVFLSEFVFRELEEHLERLTRPKQKESEYLFPSFRGSMRTHSALDKPFADVAKRIGLPYRVTPRAMRRTFQDLCREAGVDDFITRKISGHETEAMQERYSTAQKAEIRKATDNVYRLIRPALAAAFAG